MNRAYYSSSINNFLDKNEYEILVKLQLMTNFQLKIYKRILEKRN